MNTKQKLWRTLSAILIVGVASQFFFGALSQLFLWKERVGARIKLPVARALWDSKEISHYKFDVEGGNSMQCFIWWNVEVKDGNVIQAKLIDPEESLWLPPDTAYLDDPFLCNSRNYTMPILFDILEKSIDYVNSVSFDPTYGFISRAGFGNYTWRGIFLGRIADCCGGFTISNFQILDK